jgi:hypothetical protein
MSSTPFIRYRDNHLHGTGHELHLHRRVPYEIAISLHRQRPVGADRNVPLYAQTAYVGAALLPAEQDVSRHSEVIDGCPGAHDAYVKSAVVQTNVRPPAKRRVSHGSTVGDRDFGCAYSNRLTIHLNGKTMGLYAEELAYARPNVGDHAKPALILALGVMHCQRTDAHADVQDEKPIADPDCIDMRGVVSFG